MNKNNKIEDAKKLYNEFSGHDLAGEEYELEFPDDIVVFPVGTITGIMYKAVRDGIEEEYLHEFDEGSRPTLCSTHDGDQLFIVGGEYEFTDHGIEDR